MEYIESSELLSDLQLIEALCSQEDDDLLYLEFVNRFLPELKESCILKCKARKLDTHIGIEIAHRAFENVRKYKSFKKDKIKIPNDTEAIKIYLIRITVSLFNDYYKKEKQESIPPKCYFDDIFEAASFGTSEVDLKNKRDFAELVLKKLNKKEQIVVFTDIEHKKYRKYLPEDITESLSNQLGVKKDSIRRIRKRAIEKIYNAIDEINQN